MPEFAWNADPIVDFIGHELVEADSDLVSLLEVAEASLESVGTNFGRDMIVLRLIVPQTVFRAFKRRLKQVQDELELIAMSAFASFDDVTLHSVSVVPRVTADPSWRRGVERPVVVTDQREDEIWKRPGLLRLFLSHKSDEKVALAAVKAKLFLYGIDSFLAHEEITPTKAWAKVIQHGLQTCDAMLAVGTAGLHSSSWCMQEVGWALGRGILVLPVLAGERPTGLHAELQGPTVTLTNASDSAKKIALALCEDDRMKPRIFAGIARRLQGAGSGSETWSVWQAFEDLWPCPDEQVDEVINAMEGNPEAMKSTAAVPRFTKWKARVRPPERDMNAFASGASPSTDGEYDPFAED